MRRLISTAAIAAMAATSLGMTAATAEYPEKPVSFVVPFPPGDLEDVITRMIAEDFQAKYGVAAAVINKPSDGGPFPGAAEVAVAPPDGYTIGSFVVGIPVVGPQVGIPELNPDPFEPLGIFVTYPFVMASAKNSGIDTVEDLKGTDDKVLGHFGSFLIPTQVSFAMAKQMGFEWGSEAAFDALDCNTLASGDVDVINTTLQLILPCLEDVNVIASITGERIAKTPDTPTVGELDPSLAISLWNGLFVHKDTPQDVRDKIIAVASETVMSDRAQEVARNTGAQIYWLGADESAAQIQKDIATTAAIEKMIAN
ncbi:tripartite tricarboxylate transporter substrate binding protein [Hoeflea poritis]|uniref:Tripartite tricarboxylate transporter substrate binding protein n=1 Tax=Hoeflea poritis TaxID=2993659 RepID=A0ABT4VUD3_9HYPH|nr:tripartite tricarboxylate transporter substrate binding protein [Hoeflea poritis]MDA4848323.1 tripartite tricarboxylate transporter substrate binding protein [Hoeflea poritis]